MIYDLKLKYNPEDAVEYFEILKRDFQDYHWEYKTHHNEPGIIDPKNNLIDMHGWGLQTIYDDPTFPYHADMDPHDEGPEYFKDTPMVFGFFERLKNLLINPFRSFLITSPKGHYISWCNSHNPLHGTIFIPVETNSEAYFRTKKDLNKKVHLELGKMFLVDHTTYAFEFNNPGATSVTGIQISVPIETFSHVLDLRGTV